jgi:hypothetical protein
MRSPCPPDFLPGKCPGAASPVRPYSENRRSAPVSTREEYLMPKYAAIIYATDIDPTTPEATDMMKDYDEFGAGAAAVIRGGAALYPTATATTVRVTGGKGGDLVTSDGPYAETKEALTGFYLLECADLDEAIKVAARIPGAWDGAIEVRPVVDFGK